MKPTWIYETGVFNTEEQPDADEQFVAALKKQNLEVLEFDKNSMLRNDFASKLREAKFDKVPVYRGSFRSCRAMGLDQQVDKYIEAANDFAVKYKEEADE